MIQLNQELYFKNLLSYRANITQQNMPQLLKEIDTFIKENNLTVTGPKISTTYSMTQTMTPTMDIELLIPVDKEFTETDKIKFKPEFKLVNALKESYIGNPAQFNDTIMSIQQYLSDNKLTPISSLYTVNIVEITNPEDIEKFHTDLYISLSPNIL